MVSFKSFCEMFAGDQPFNYESDYDLTKCTGMISSDEDGEYLIVYLPLSDGSVSPSGIDDDVETLLSESGYSTEIVFDGEAIIAR